MVQPFDFAGGDDQRPVADGPHVCPAQGHEQVDVRGPGADAFEGGEGGLGFGIGQVRHAVQVQFPGQDGVGQEAGVADLLAAKTNPAQGFVVQGQEALGRERVRFDLQPIQGGLGRGQGDLLFQDNVDQGDEARFTGPKGGRAEAVHHPGQIRVRGAEGGDVGGVAFVGE